MHPWYRAVAVRLAQVGSLALASCAATDTRSGETGAPDQGWRDQGPPELILPHTKLASWASPHDVSSVETRERRADDDQQFIPEGYPEPFGIDLTRSWLEAWPHNHLSRRGTPFVHLFSLEPAFLGRDLFLDYRTVTGPDENETELEVELEYAVTRRIGVVLEVPYVQLDPDGASSESGVGDFAIAPRVLLVDAETFLLSANLEVAFPSGEESKGLGSGEVGLAPSLSAWFDLGHWLQASLQAGTEHGVDSGDAEVFYNGALAYSFLTPSLFNAAEHDHDHTGSHSLPGLTSGILELTGRTVVDGQDDGRSTAALLFGINYNVTGSWEVRSAYQLPLGGSQDIDRGFVLGLIRHF